MSAIAAGGPSAGPPQAGPRPKGHEVAPSGPRGPTDGIVARRNVQPGQHVESVTPLMAVVPLEDV